MVVVAGPVFSLVILFATCVEALPWPAYKKLGTHRSRKIGRRQVEIEGYYPRSSFKVYGEGGPSVSASSRAGDSSKILTSAIASLVTDRNLSTGDVLWSSGYDIGSSRFGWVRQTHNGVPLANAVANIAVNGEKVVSFGSSFVDVQSLKISSSEPTLSWRAVLPQIESSLDGTYDGGNATLEYLVKRDGSVALTHVIQIRNDQTNAHYEAFIDAHTGELLSVTDFVTHASYTVLPITKQNFPQGTETLDDPQDLASSPLGWHDTGSGNSTTTSGNNVAAFRNRQLSVQTSDGLNFNDAYDDSKDPTDPLNLNAARQNAFFILNVMHDFSYRYGFTEDAFNFQVNNFDKGGRGNDGVLVSVQDGSGFNNANFATPPDGQPGVCRMFIWNRSNPRRDGTMENDIVIHEMTHGITNRLTGGGTARCLQTLESGGLGEGWGDAMANWMGQTSAQTTDFAIAPYVSNNPRGLRRFPYSVNTNTNPLTYASLQQLNEVHGIGEVWANMLHNVYADLVNAHGFSDEKLTNPDGQEGNIVFMRLFMDALSLQPCNPTFVDARDAWIQADQNRYQGANKCIISKAFASRGLGLNADDTFVDDSSVPDDC